MEQSAPGREEARQGRTELSGARFYSRDNADTLEDSEQRLDVLQKRF